MTERPPLPDEVPVVVAGGGPVGLACAVELSHHGIDCVVIEPRTEVSWLRPRAKTTSVRTMEHLRRWGLADELRRRAPLPMAWSDEAVFCTAVLGGEITRFSGCFGLDLAGSDLVSEPGQQVAQPVVERLLRDAVAGSAHARLVTGARVAGVAEDESGVFVDVVVDVVADADAPPHRIRADYAVGCEGARSVVRDAIGAHYEGSDHPRLNFNMVFRSPGLYERTSHGPVIHYWVLNPAQPGLVGRMDLDDLWWCGAVGVDGDSSEVDAVQIVRNLVGDDIDLDILSTDTWRARMLLADRYGSARMFVAGDAAHQNPPWGGHGFNTGVGDAVNIGWKLAAVVAGWAPASLLASYEAERRPVAEQTMAEAVRNMSSLSSDLARLPPTSVAEAIQASKASEFHSLGLTLGYDYEASPIVCGDSGPNGPPHSNEVYVPTAAAGHRLPHKWLGPGRSLFDELGRGFSVVGEVAGPVGQALVAAARRRGVPVAEVELRGEEWRQHFGAPLVLVRPDQHVAWRGGADGDAIAIIARAVGASAEEDERGGEPAPHRLAETLTPEP